MEANKTGSKDIKQANDETEKITRVVISKEAEQAVTEVMDDVNDGFEAGRATRLDVTSYMLIWFKDNAPEDARYTLRMQLADELTMLDSIVKKAKASGNLPPALREALSQHFFGSGHAPSKRAKKSLKQENLFEIPKTGDAA